MNKSNKPRICRTCGTAYTGWRCPKCKPKRHSASNSNSGRRFGGAARVLASASLAGPIGPINPSACPPPEMCLFCGFEKSRCFCPRQRSGATSTVEGV